MEKHEKFILALNAKRKVSLTYRDDVGHALVSRKCIPVDYCEYKKEGSGEEGFCFRFWDCKANEMIEGRVKDEQIDSMEILDEDYDLQEYKSSGFCEMKCVVVLFALLAITVFIVAWIKYL